MADTGKSMPALLRAAVWWEAHGIRGRSAVARAVGRWQRPDRPLFIRTRHGAALSVDFANFDVYAAIYNRGGCWETNIMDACERVLRPGDIFFDIGSNTGVFALDFSKSIPNLTTFAFEPQPSLAQHIRRSVEANQFGGVKVLEVLLGDEEGEATLFLTSHAVHASIVPREQHYRELRLPLRTLDGLVASGEIAPADIIKIDVEGSELKVFRGAERMLREHQPSVVFEADENMNRMGFTAENLFDTLTKAAPYRFFMIDDAGSLALAEKPYPFGNYLALSPRHANRI